MGLLLLPLRKFVTQTSERTRWRKFGELTQWRR